MRNEKQPVQCAADTTFGPGPSPDTVRTASGQVLTVPEGWTLLPPGDAALTRRVKAAGEHWVVQEKKGRKIFSRGVWAPAATIERIRAELEAERSTESYAKKQQSAVRRREKVQTEYVQENWPIGWRSPSPSMPRRSAVARWRVPSASRWRNGRKRR
jgi:hypothetical protein